ncbi:dephospho-CoA kinase/protein folding accessory domain-containing protein [Legionella massiliensis]|uniref:Dephospho-CoA kinase/protein folding accessory domain-containing protein n=1 Tax=Legionella massiliensis TaxID=1034943 RepID=A0A078L103_9GAMM|nr:GNAT family N-acetyltransferase [Legionella massiliensis]CDZ77738.1 dephospho-CoA kinase/protein folding accessory domain-containing protein [Legionella massiliensis]CEE13476.1 dephospho-CoA kinase/protein folding accessory domain-containing protein [Legionella massiliensis]
MTDLRLIEVVPYDAEWPKKFAAEAALIKDALGENCVDIHHIGSTAVPGLAAKPVIDMIPVVTDITKVDLANPLMQKLGYLPRGEFGMLFRRFFQKGEDQRTFNIHVFETGNSEIDRHLLFRNWMRVHLEDRDAYANLKQNLAKQHPHDISAYCFGKEEFVSDIDRKAGFKGLRIVKALTPREWESAKHFRQFYFFNKANLVDPYTWTFTDPNHVHFVLYKSTELVGYAHIQLWPNHRAALRIIVIDEPYRNQGIGGFFMQSCERWLRQNGLFSLHIDSNKAAENFYRQRGYSDMPFNDPDGYESHPDDIALGIVFG